MRILALVLAAFLPVVILASILVFTAANQAHENLQYEISKKASVAIEEIDQAISTDLAVLQALAASKSLDHGDILSFHEDMHRFQSLRPLWHSVNLATPDGRVVLNLRRLPLDDRLILERQSFEKVLHTGKPAVGGFIPNAPSNLALVPIRVPVFRDSQLRYVLSAALLTDRITDFITKNSGGWLGSLGDQNGRVIARTKDADKYVGLLAPQPALDVIASGVSSGFYESPALSGEEASVVYSVSPLSGWSVHFIMPKDALNLPLTRSLVLAIAGAGLALGLGLVFLWMVHRDFSIQRETECSLRTARDAAEAGNRAKTEFLATMSHELRTPLNAIIGFSDLLKSEIHGPLDRHYRGYSKEISESGAHLLHLVNGILDLVKIEAGQLKAQMESLDVAAIMTDCLKVLKPEIEAASLTLTFDATQPCVVTADRRRIKQVFFNLLTNAIKFTEPGGAITVTVRSAGESRVEVMVTDTGIGMTENELEIAFEPFRQVDNSLTRKYEGTGLGLPLAKRLAELQGGKLILQSQPRVGTTAIVSLSRSKEMAGSHEATAA